MDYRVRFVDDDLMPEGKDWVVCTQGGVTTCFVKRNYRCETERQRRLEEAWVGYLQLASTLTPAS